MPRTWTHEERKKHIKERYGPPKQKAAIIIVSFLVILVALYLTIVGFSGSIPLQVVSGLLVAVTLLLFFLGAWGGMKTKSPIILFLILLVILIILLTLWLIELSALAQLIIAILMGFLLLVIIGIAVFFVDIITFEF